MAASLIAGVRFIDLNESISIYQASSTLADATVQFGVPFNANATSTLDQIRGVNTFYGGQVGARAAASWRQFFFGMEGKIAMGDMHEVVTVNGSSTLDSPTATSGTQTQPIPPTSIAVGRFAAPTNIGRHFSDRFAFVPQAEGRLGIQ